MQTSSDFFSKLSLEAQRDLAALQSPLKYDANITLFTEKEPTRGVFILTEGEVRLSINSSEGKRLSLRIARRGDMIGLCETLSGSSYEMTAETLYPARIALIGRREFMGFLSRHPEAYQALTEIISRQMTIACEQLRTVGLASSAPEKLARLLLEWSENGQTIDGQSRMRFSLTHEQIGEFIGASRETVTRTLSNFKHRQLVSFHGSMLTIPNRSALASFARG